MVPKTITFESNPSNPGKLSVSVYNEEEAACTTGGFLLYCTAPSGTAWDGFTSDLTNWSSDDGDLCTAASGFYLGGSGSAVKIWCSSGDSDCTMTGEPTGETSLPWVASWADNVQFASGAPDGSAIHGMSSNIY